MGDTCVPSLIVTKNNLLPEATSCCLQTCNVAASKEIVGERCVGTKSYCHQQYS